MNADLLLLIQLLAALLSTPRVHKRDCVCDVCWPGIADTIYRREFAPPASDARPAHLASCRATINGFGVVGASTRLHRLRIYREIPLPKTYRPRQILRSTESSG